MGIIIYVDATCFRCKSLYTVLIDTIKGDVRRGRFVGANEQRRIWTLPCQHMANLAGSAFRHTPEELPHYGMYRNRAEMDEN